MAMTENVSPFVPGARVAVTDYHGDGWREDFVEKAYKNGRFTLRGSKQQWRPWRVSYGDNKWSATQAGSDQRYSRRRVTIWDQDVDASIAARIEANELRARWNELRGKLNSTSPTKALCDAIEAALCITIGT